MLLSRQVFKRVNQRYFTILFAVLISDKSNNHFVHVNAQQGKMIGFLTGEFRL